MAAQQTQQTEKLIADMLGFLDSTDDDEDANNNNNNTMKDEENSGEENFLPAEKDTQNKKKEQQKTKSSIAKELKKIKKEFPIWNDEESANAPKKLIDPIWQQTPAAAAGKYESTAVQDDWNSKMESNCRRSSSNTYVQEVNRAIYGDTTGHPPNGSAEYFQAAQNYAIYGKDFLDFPPENLTPLLSQKGDVTASPVASCFTTSYGGNSLYATPAATAETAAGAGFGNFGKQPSSGSSTSATAYYQMCNGMQPNSIRPTASGSTAYGMLLGNKVTYVAAAPAAPTLIYNQQHTSTTTNFISNSLANAALASSPAILYSNPMLTTTTQQYLNTFFKETQYLSGATAQGTSVGTTTGIYERLVYAQMLQQQIYHQNQQQAAAVAAMFHKCRAARASTNGTSGGGGGAAPVGCSANCATQNLFSSNNNTLALHICGRQAGNDLLTKSCSLPTPITANGDEANAPSINE